MRVEDLPGTDSLLIEEKNVHKTMLLLALSFLFVCIISGFLYYFFQGRMGFGNGLVHSLATLSAPLVIVVGISLIASVVPMKYPMRRLVIGHHTVRVAYLDESGNECVVLEHARSACCAWVYILRVDNIVDAEAGTTVCRDCILIQIAFKDGTVSGYLSLPELPDQAALIDVYDLKQYSSQASGAQVRAELKRARRMLELGWISNSVPPEVQRR